MHLFLLANILKQQYIVNHNKTETAHINRIQSYGLKKDETGTAVLLQIKYLIFENIFVFLFYYYK